MKDLVFAAIIPARYASTRFPGKPLAMLGDRTVIEHVYTQASKAVPYVAVATDDDRIAEAVRAFGGNAVMTSDKHRSGTDRVSEAAGKLGFSPDVIINVQGDEPFIHPTQIQSLMQCFSDQRTQIATLLRPFPADCGIEALRNPNTPKVVVDNDGFALYFSRSVIPYIRSAEEAEWPRLHQYWAHVGVYAYRAEILGQLSSLPPSPLEQAESLEQLRWLQAGYKIKTAVTEMPTIGIDTPDDLERARQYLSVIESEN